jgi:hypothetical protein
MAQDTQFTATGTKPPSTGFTSSGDITNFHVGAQLIGTEAGVQGVCTNQRRNPIDAGVQGFGTGPGVAGVFGTALPAENGTLVSPGPGVWGLGGGGLPPIPPPSDNAIGVYGRAGSGNADGVQGVGSGTSPGWRVLRIQIAPPVPEPVSSVRAPPAARRARDRQRWDQRRSK